MRQLRYALAMLVAVLAALPLSAQQNRKSPHETVSTVLGERSTGNRITVIYGRPYTKDPRTGQPRVIWGGLVGWDKPDRLGADEATTLITEKPLLIGTTVVPAGAYTLYTIPSEKGPSVLGISTHVGKWGVPVDDKHDLARVTLKKEALESPVDQLTIAIDKDSEGGGVLKIQWEKTQFLVALGTPPLAFPAASPTETLKQRIGVTDFEVVYSRPSAKGRVMLGGNNPYGQVWRTGANSATRISFDSPVLIEGSRLDAGTYELFSIPGADQWTVIFQKASGQWGAYSYDPKNDVLRVNVKPVALASPVETFTIDFNDIHGGSATLNLIWEKTRVPVKIDVDLVGVFVPKIEAALAAPGKRPYAQAAIFFLDNNLDLNKASAWMDAAIAEQKDVFYYLYQKARILAKKGDKAGAEALARRSMELAAKETGPAKDEYIRLNEALISSLK